jgi:hypothetical protein
MEASQRFYTINVFSFQSGEYPDTKYADPEILH